MSSNNAMDKYLKEDSYVDQAENVIRELSGKTDKRGNRISLVSTSKLRNLLSMTADIYNEVCNDPSEKLSSEICGRIEYLRIRFVYESGREPKVRDLVNEAGILDILKNINGSRTNFILFSRYMEALVAFRKYYGKDKDE